MPDFNLPNIAAQAIGTPLLMHPAKLDNILSFLGPRLISGADWGAVIQADHVEHRDSADYIVADGVAIIPIVGSLVHRGRSMNSSGVTAYQAIDANLHKAMNDNGVHSILLDIDSPGGQVAGMFALANSILEMRQHKHITAVANELAASAAYGLGCAASEFVVSPTATAGSIGVVMAHVDYSKQLAEQGVAVTYIYAGDQKVAGNPYEPLPETVKADLQQEIDGIYQLFTSHVAKSRGISQQRVIDTQARVFIGEGAVSAGLADRVSTIEAEFTRLKARNNQRGAGSRRFANREQGTTSMSVPNQGDSNNATQPAAATTEATTPPAAAHTDQTAVLELTQSEVDAAKLDAFQNGADNERKRSLAIIDSGAELGISAGVIRKMIENGSSIEASTDTMLAIKESVDEASAINTSHTAGAQASTARAMPSNAEIYAKRNGGL